LELLVPADVLVADDDRGVRLLIVETLREQGFEVRAVADGRAALEACAARMPDVIVLDLEMPIMGGREFVIEIRKSNSRPPPMVLVSAHGAQERARELGIRRWIQKPFDERRLIAQVAAAIAA
jgi:two-component system response regulator (stage 0 sporulation protein F)